MTPTLLNEDSRNTLFFFFFLRDNSTYMVESSLGFTQKKKKELSLG